MEEYAPHIKERLFDSPNQEIWTAVAEDKVGEAIELIKTKLQAQPIKRKFFEFLTKTPEIKGKAVLEIASEILEKKSPSKLKNLNLKLNGNDDLNFAELIRFLMALSLNGNYKSRFDVADTALKNLISLAQEVQDKAGNYPDNPITGDVWMGGMFIREWSEDLANFFLAENLYEKEAETRFFKCKITNSIMNHYHHLVGPDMIALAKCYEKLNHKDYAEGIYKPVIMDFEWFLSEYEQNSEVPNEDDCWSLLSLLAAYAGLERVSDSNYSEKIKKVEEILERVEKASA